jgi:hypothetical protein
MNALFLKDLAEKAAGGLRGRIEDGKYVQSRCGADVGLCGRPTDIRCPRSFRPGLAEFELDTIPFAQVVDTLSVDGAGVKEHLFARGISNKAKSLVCSERLDRACHPVTSFHAWF